MHNVQAAIQKTSLFIQWSNYRLSELGDIIELGNQSVHYIFLSEITSTAVYKTGKGSKETKLKIRGEMFQKK